LWSKKFNENDYVEDPDIDGRILLKLMLKTIMGCEPGSSDLGKGLEVVFCEDGNEFSGLYKFQGISLLAERLSDSQ
jgi:hypothetical protein